MKPGTFKLLVFLILFTIGIVGWVTLFGHEGWLAYRRLSQAENQMRQGITALKEKNDKLSTEIYRLKHDRDFLERVIRQQLDMAKKDELVFKFR